MPEISNMNQLWHRGGNIPNQKRHIHLSEAEKSNVALCKGTKQFHPCKNPIFRCSNCGNYGCIQDDLGKCDAQGFKNNKCLHCGTIDSMIPVMKEDLDHFIEEWEKEPPAMK